MGTTLETADTQHIEAAGIRFAFRKLGPDSGVPLVFLQHFTGTMDAWIRASSMRLQPTALSSCSTMRA